MLQLVENVHIKTTDDIARIDVIIFIGWSLFFKIIRATNIENTGAKYLRETAAPISNILNDLQYRIIEKTHIKDLITNSIFLFPNGFNFCLLIRKKLINNIGIARNSNI